MNGIVEGINFEVCANTHAAQLLVIEEGLNDFNDLMTGMSDRQPLAVLITMKYWGNAGALFVRSTFYRSFLFATRVAENGDWYRNPFPL